AQVDRGARGEWRAGDDGRERRSTVAPRTARRLRASQSGPGGRSKTVSWRARLDRSATSGPSPASLRCKAKRRPWHNPPEARSRRPGNRLVVLGAGLTDTACEFSPCGEIAELSKLWRLCRGDWLGRQTGSGSLVAERQSCQLGARGHSEFRVDAS